MNGVLVLVILILTVLLIVSQVVHCWTSQKLINKIMSRNYTEFVQAENMNKPIKDDGLTDFNKIADDDAIRQARDANSLLGVN